MGGLLACGCSSIPKTASFAGKSLAPTAPVYYVSVAALPYYETDGPTGSALPYRVTVEIDCLPSMLYSVERNDPQSGWQTIGVIDGGDGGAVSIPYWIGQLDTVEQWRVVSP